MGNGFQVTASVSPVPVRHGVGRYRRPQEHRLFCQRSFAGKQAGLSDAQIEQLDEKGFSSGDFSPAEQVVIRFAYETTRDVKCSDEAMNALKEHYDNKAIAEIAFVVATGNFIQRIGKNLGVELEG